MKPRSTPSTNLDQIRAAVEAPPGAAEAADRERLAKLQRISNDPQQQAAFGSLTDVEILRITIYGLLEAQNWALAARYTVALNRIEREASRATRPAPVEDAPAPPAATTPTAPSAITPGELRHLLDAARRVVNQQRTSPPVTAPEQMPTASPIPQAALAGLDYAVSASPPFT